MSAWTQCAYSYDGTFAGFLTCVGESFRHREYPEYFFPPGSGQLCLYPLREISTDPVLAGSVYHALETRVSGAFRRLVIYSFLTCLPLKERQIYDAVHLGLLRSLPRDRTDDRVLILTRAVRHLTREAEQYRGFVRFSDYGGVLVGQIAPENRVLPLLRPHFCRRMPEKAFLLHDRTHREGLFYACHKWKIRPVDRLDLERPDRADLEFRALWRRFYETTAVHERQDPKLRQNKMPGRFRGEMTGSREDPA